MKYRYELAMVCVCCGVVVGHGQHHADCDRKANWCDASAVKMDDLPHKHAPLNTPLVLTVAMSTSAASSSAALDRIIRYITSTS